MSYPAHLKNTSLGSFAVGCFALSGLSAYIATKLASKIHNYIFYKNGRYPLEIWGLPSLTYKPIAIAAIGGYSSGLIVNGLLAVRIFNIKNDSWITGAAFAVGVLGSGVGALAASERDS